MARVAIGWFGLTCLVLAGCGLGSDMSRVRGTITLNGQPLANATVEFQPLGAKGAPSAARTDAQGRYELMYTFDQAGAIPGDYRVSIRTAETCFDEQGREREQLERVPARYNSRTELTRTVEPGRNTIDFDL